jgi:hemoglobin
MTNFFEKYGGFAAVSQIVRDFYKGVMASPRLKPYFHATNVDYLIEHQTKFLSQILGGPAEYNGRALLLAHANMGITEEAFTEVAEILQDVLEDNGIEDEDLSTIMGIVGSVKDQIVTGA